MFPIGDENRQGHIVPLVNYLLIAINFVVFYHEITLGSDQAIQTFINQYGVVPRQILAGQHLSTLLTSMFVHGGWAHILGNMVFLWVFGDNVEDAFGHLGYLVFYLVTGLAAAAAHILLNQASDVPSVGASGAISGVLGAYLIFFGGNPIRVLIFFFITTVPAWLMIGLWAIQQFMATYGALAHTYQTADGVAYAAHAGGFLAGMLIAAYLRTSLGRPGQRPATNRGWRTY
jgi:membrane associated rhomboid family serine protease